MWSPGAAAIITTFLYQRNLRGLGWRPGQVRYLVFGYVAPLLCAVGAYGVVFASGAVGFPNPIFVAALAEQFGRQSHHMGPASLIAVALIYQGSVGMAIGIPFALGEELGWRGFLVPRLCQLASPFWTSVVSGLVCSLYHYPIILFAGYHSGGPWWQNVACFTALLVASAFVLTWLRMRSGSIWPAVLAHAAHNSFLQGFLDPLAVDGLSRRMLLTEFGVVLPFATGLLAIYVWNTRSEVPQPPETPSEDSAGCRAHSRERPQR